MFSILAFAFGGRQCLQYRRRRLKLKNDASEHKDVSNDRQPYFQSKGKLDAEERRKYELQAEERQFELEENEIRELSTTDDSKAEKAPRGQQRKGEEHYIEME